MASPPLLDFETLLAPIAGVNPAGEPLPFAVGKKLDDARKEINPKQFASDDPRRPEAPQPADWSGIEQLTQDTLARTSKDLLVAARLTEALVKRHGFGGLRDGLRLMRRLAEDCWDRVYPVIEEGDLDGRAGRFNWLDDEVKGARFPYTLRTVPLTKTDDEKTYGWQQWKDAQDARGPVTTQAFDQAIAATSREYCQTVVEDIAESVKELTELTKVLRKSFTLQPKEGAGVEELREWTKVWGSKFSLLPKEGASLDELTELSKEVSAMTGEAAPGLSQVRKALLECQELAQHILKRKGPAPVAKQDGAAPPTESAVAAEPAAAPAARRPLTREDLLTRLAEASALLLEMEPQSPIAYMIQRAIKLARLPLPDLMRVLVRDPGVLGQLDRDLDLGFEKQEAAKQEAAKAGKK